MGKRRARRPATKPATPALHVPKSDISISAPHLFRLLTSALLWASSDATRPHLNQVHFVNEGGKVAMFATDGHGLWFCDAAPFEGFAVDDAFSFGLSVEDARALLRLVRHRREPSYGTADTAVFSRSSAGTMVTMGRCAYTFDAMGDVVPWRRVVPDGTAKPAARVGVNGNYLAKAAKSLSYQWPHEVAIRLGGTLDAMRFDGAVAGVPVSVIIMPLRLDS